MQHAATQSIECGLGMRDLQARASPATHELSLVAGAGQRFESARRLSTLGLDKQNTRKREAPADESRLIDTVPQAQAHRVIFGI